MVAVSALSLCLSCTDAPRPGPQVATTPQHDGRQPLATTASAASAASPSATPTKRLRTSKPDPTSRVPASSQPLDNTRLQLVGRRRLGYYPQASEWYANTLFVAHGPYRYCEYQQLISAVDSRGGLRRQAVGDCRVYLLAGGQGGIWAVTQSQELGEDAPPILRRYDAHTLKQTGSLTLKGQPWTWRDLAVTRDRIWIATGSQLLEIRAPVLKELRRYAIPLRELTAAPDDLFGTITRDEHSVDVWRFDLRRRVMTGRFTTLSSPSHFSFAGKRLVARTEDARRNCRVVAVEVVTGQHRSRPISCSSTVFATGERLYVFVRSDAGSLSLLVLANDMSRRGEHKYWPPAARSPSPSESPLPPVGMGPVFVEGRRALVLTRGEDVVVSSYVF